MNLLAPISARICTLPYHANLEGKVDDQGEKMNKVLTVVSSLPSRSDLEEILERSSSYAVLKSEHDRMKKVIGEQHHVEI